MAIPSTVEIVLIVAITGIIAISVYVLYLVDRLLSRIENLEQTIISYQETEGRKPEELEKTLQQTTASVSVQIDTVNEILESTGKDIDSINVKITACVHDLATAKERIDGMEKKFTENKNDAASIRKDISALSRKLEQLENETELIASRQQLSAEF